VLRARIALASTLLSLEAHAAGNARVYARNPLRTPTPSVVALPIAVSGATLTSAGLRAVSCVDEGAGVCALRNVARADATGDFLFDPATDPDVVTTDAFAETSAYVHAARAIALFRTLGGADPPFARADRPLTVVANARLAEATGGRLGAFGGAFFLGDESGALRTAFGVSGDAVVLGVGPSLAFAYDADVVVHETTHALVHTTLGAAGYRATPRGLTAEPEAISEAISDYFAAVAANDPRLGDYVARVAEAPDALRAIDRRATCADLTGEPHDDGLVLSGALWEARSAAGDPVAFDRAVYRALEPRETMISFAAFGARVRDPALDRALTARGVGAEPCVPTRELRTAQSLTTLHIAPGTRRSGGSLAPGVVQLRAEVPAGTVRARVRFAGGSTPLFGATPTPFNPLVLARWDGPITWSGPSYDAPLAVETELSGASFEAVLDAATPAARTLYLQIANRGEADGFYDAITIAFEAAPPSPLPPAPSAGGSGCTTSGTKTESGEGLFALAALLSLVRRRR